MSQTRFIYTNQGGSPGPSTPFTARVLTAANLVQDPNSALGTVTYGPASMTIPLNNVDPGNINGAVPDCVLWHWLMADPFDYTTNCQIMLRLQFTGAINDSWNLYLGVYDGTVASAHGVYTGVRFNNGATGCEEMGQTMVTGNAAGAMTTGGKMNGVYNLDADFSRGRGTMVRSSSPGPAYGRLTRNTDPGSWAGTALYGFLAIGATGARAAGTITDLSIEEYVVPGIT